MYAKGKERRAGLTLTTLTTTKALVMVTTELDKG